MCALALIYRDGVGGFECDPMRTLEWYRRAGEAGHTKAQYKLGLMYYTGMGVEQSVKQAVTWLQPAADVGLPQAMYWLAMCLHEGGSDLERNSTKAREWMEAAAEKGHPDAKAFLDHATIEVNPDQES